MMDIATLKQFGAMQRQYAFYPTADRFIEAFGAAEYSAWLKKRGIGGFGRTMGLYVQAPFIDTNCAFCGRTKAVRSDRDLWTRYLASLQKEALLKSSLLSEHSVVQVHWGGNIPVSLLDDEFCDLTGVLSQHFDRSDSAEISIELDPRCIEADTMSKLVSLGFNRICIRTRELDLSAATTRNQDQIDAATEALVENARANGIQSINVELTYALPRQTLMSFNRVLRQTIALAPERIILCDDAHMRPALQIRSTGGEIAGPDVDTQLQLFSLAVMRLLQAGYVHIGMDHFAKPTDALAVAQRQGRLHRNFQGYLTHADCDVLGLGVSSFSMVGPTYSQNARTLDEYFDRLDHDRLPVTRGVELTADDLARRTVMHALMCHFEVAFQSVEIAHLINFRDYFAREIEDLRKFVDAGLVQIDDKWLYVTEEGRYVVSALCSVFDRYLREGRQRVSFERVM